MGYTGELINQEFTKTVYVNNTTPATSFNVLTIIEIK